jgi:hypothetical protein
MGVWARGSVRCHIAFAVSLLTIGASLGCSSGGGTKPGTPGAAGTTGAAGTGSSGGGSTGAAGAAAGTTGAAGTGAAGAAAGTNGAAGTTGAAGAAAGTTGTAGAGGAAAGATGTAGAGGAGALTQILPVMRAGLYVLEFGTTKFVVDPTKGARITEFSLGGTNILTGPTANPMYWGSTLWSAPEGEWLPGGLIAAYDTGTFTMSVGADSSFTGVGPTSTIANNMKTVAVTKTFAADLAKGAIAIEYSLTNKGTNTFNLGHWEVTRVPPDGLTFFPVGTGNPVVNAGPIATCCITTMGGYVWSDHAKYAMGSAYGKYSIDGSGGWVAHVVTDPAGNLLLIKTFKDIPTGTAGAGHGEVEIYFDPMRKYVEVEDHHEQAMFAAGATIPWSVRWYLRRLPPSVTRTVGSQALIDFVLAQIK